MASLRVPVRYPAVAAVAGKLYVFGGEAITGRRSGRPLNDIQEVDPAAAVGVALQTFEDGVYFVFVDGNQYTQMDDVIYLKADSHVLFLRLVALVGG